MIQLRDQYVQRFAGIGGVATVIAHDEQFGHEELARVSAKNSPSVFLTCAGGTIDEDRDYDPVLQCRWIAVVAAKSGDARRDARQTRGDVAHVIAQRIARELVRGGFASALSQASEIELANLSNTALARKGYALWAVAWQQDAPLDDASGLALADLTSIVTSFDIAGDSAPETTDRVEFP